MIIRIGLPETTGSLPIACEQIEAYALVSACRLYDKERKRFRHPGQAIMDLSVALDCGGYTALKCYGGYPYTLEEYMRLGVEYGWDWYASMDYCCEPEVLPEISTMLRQVYTLTQYLRSRAVIDGWQESFTNEYGRPNVYIRYPVPVLQGWTIEDYLLMVRWYRENVFGDDNWPDLVAIGSVCRRNKVKEIANIIDAILNSVPDNVKLHLFGVKGTTLKTINLERIESIDSNAWDFASRCNSRRLGIPNTNKRRAVEMESWYNKQHKIVKEIKENVKQLEKFKQLSLF